MKETIIITCAVVMSLSALFGQSSKKKATIRIRQIENVNGVETIKDTSFTSEDPNVMVLQNHNLNLKEIDGKNVTLRKIFIANDLSTVSDSFDFTTMGLDLGNLADAENLMKEVEKAKTSDGKHHVVILTHSGKLSKLKGEKDGAAKSYKAHIFITDLDPKDKTSLKAELEGKDDVLQVEHLDFFPNPNNGKFNLSFKLPIKGDTKVSIISMDGKVVYYKNLDNFIGTFKTEVNISDNAKGVYFVKVEQNEQSILKKIVLE
jgi:Secretion system C-terminal sorting domain